VPRLDAPACCCRVAPSSAAHKPLRLRGATPPAPGARSLQNENPRATARGLHDASGERLRDGRRVKPFHDEGHCSHRNMRW
jgi:hypothetical protein